MCKGVVSRKFYFKHSPITYKHIVKNIARLLFRIKLCQGEKSSTRIRPMRVIGINILDLRVLFKNVEAVII